MQTAKAKTMTTKKKPIPSAPMAEVWTDPNLALECAQCGASEKSKKREISGAAWSALVSWKEVSSDCVDKPICQACYNELREILIDRADELVRMAPSSKDAGQKRAC